MTNTSRSSDKPLRILVLEKYIDTLSKLIDVPHQLFPFNKEDDESYTRKLRDIDVMISSAVKGSWLSKDGPLRLIQGVGAGTEGIDFAGLPADVTVCNVFGHEWAVAEYCFMTMGMLKREVIRQDKALRIGYWSGGVFRHELRGCNLLVIGLGHIGAEVARWGKFYQMKVTGLTRSPSTERQTELGVDGIGGLDELYSYLPQADFVIVAIPHVADTAGFIGSAELALMKRTAFLVNVARGPVVDETSLYLALRDKVIAGAANDVWYVYPNSLDEICIPANRPFHELPNIIMTPHNAGTTHGTMNYRFEFIAANIGRYYRGEPLENVVHPAA